MPKKTKRQKILAELRRRELSTSPEKVSLPGLKARSFSNTRGETPYRTEVTDNLSVNYLYTDLRKAFILTLLAILFELVLYWRLR